MVKKSWLGILIIISIGLVAVVSGRQSLKPAAPSSKTGTLRVGVILPLTGGAASLGKPTLNGMQLAVEEYNQTNTAGGFRIDLAVEDDQAQPAKAVAAFKKLIVTPGVRLIVPLMVQTSTF